MTFMINYLNEIQNKWNELYSKLLLKYNFLNAIYKTALYCAVEQRNIEIINLLLTNDKLDINILNILIQIVINIVLN